MRYHTCFAFAATAVATPLKQESVTSQNLQLTLHFRKGANPQPSIVAYNEDRNQNGYGNITMGEQIFKVLDDRKLSGGVICGGMYDDSETVVNCEITIPGLPELDPLNRWDLSNCISKRSVGSGSLYGLETVFDNFYHQKDLLPLEQPLAPAKGPLPTLESSPPSETNSSLAERQCQFTWRDTLRVGDGNPHQNPLHIQLSVTYHLLLYIPIYCQSLLGGCSNTELTRDHEDRFL
ncbi:hypothetical protein PspLS_08440 [Pyricularia sp. CBS 133598]|nr:hypothetical protein PspLS_08440 [Pyricularia sp. CBS 133598]